MLTPATIRPGNTIWFLNHDEDGVLCDVVHRVIGQTSPVNEDFPPLIVADMRVLTLAECFATEMEALVRCVELLDVHAGRAEERARVARARLDALRQRQHELSLPAVPPPGDLPWTLEVQHSD